MKKIKMLFGICICVLAVASVCVYAKTAKPCMSRKSVTLKKGQVIQLTVKHTHKKATWSSSNKAVATVKKGKVTAKKTGTATIKAKVGKRTYTCKVTVVDTKKKTTKSQTAKENTVSHQMKIEIGKYTFTATLEDNVATKELVAMMKEKPIVLKLEDYSGFEKVGPLGKSLKRSDKQTTTKSGDIVLYNGNNIVMFYGSNSWSYTRLAKVNDLSDWKKALGSGDVTVTLSLAK